MKITELFIIAIGLSMDAFVVAICKGLELGRIERAHMLKTGLYFGGFQALMPLLGYSFGFCFKDLIANVDHWIVFILLFAIGINMVREAFRKETGKAGDPTFKFSEMLLLSLTTSIDSLAVGVTFAFLDVSILRAITVIGFTAFIFSAAGIKIGNVFGEKYKSKAEAAGGIILILTGVKILVEHLFFSL